MLEQLEMTPRVSRAREYVQKTLGEELPNRALIERFRPPKGLILHPDDIWHGERHLARVTIYTFLTACLDIAEKKQHGLIAPQVPIEELLDIEGMGWGAMGHDAAREGYLDEPYHGEESAERIQECLKGKVSESSLHTAVFIASNHHIDDDRYLDPMGDELNYTNDGDAIDRVRAAGQSWETNTNLLRHDAALYVVELARPIFSRSEFYYEQGFGSHVDCAIQAAVDFSALAS